MRSSRLYLWAFAAVVAVTMGVLGYVVFFSGIFEISTISVDQLSTVSEESITRIVDQVLSGRRWKIIPARVIFVVPLEGLKTAILEELPQVQAATLRREFPRGLRITVEERDPVAIWKTESAAYEIDINATITGYRSLLDSYDLPVIESELNALYRTHDTIGGAQSIVRAYLSLRERFTLETSIDVTRWYTPSPLSSRIIAVTSEGWEARMDSERDCSTQLETLMAVLNERVDEARRAELEYIDVSTSNWAYIYP